MSLGPMGGLQPGILPVLDSPECQVDPRLVNIRFLWNLMPEVFLRFSRHDQQAAVGQPFRKGNPSVLPFETR